MEGFRLDRETGYFTDRGVDVIAFEDIYPAGHQGGVSLVMHGERVAACGDVRLEPAPGQWQSIPKQVSRTVDPDGQRIVTRLEFPDTGSHMKGFNPTVCPDCAFCYAVTVTAEGRSVRVAVDAEGPVPREWENRLYFNLELFPGLLFGRPWIMDGQQGIFPRYPAGPVERRRSIYSGGIWPCGGTPEGYADWLTEKGSAYSPMRGDEEIAAPYAVGRRFDMCPDDPLLHLTVEAAKGEISLYDGRISHNNGWFVLSTVLSSGGGRCAEWVLTPEGVDGWLSVPKVQISQVGYLPSQPKLAVAELDPGDETDREMVLWRLSPKGKTEVLREKGREWGRFLRYRYVTMDFTSVSQPGLYRVSYGDTLSEAFRIAPDVFDRGVWQPVLEYFLPIQMCHMLVREKYRIWHGRCHMDDARMAPLNWNHFDGYSQGKSTLTRFSPGDAVSGLNRGGWHDAGDFDLRVESQSGEAYQLALTYEAFHVSWDSTTIDQRKRVAELHHPDGKNDILEQIEHGALAVLGGLEALGRLYRGIIAGSLRQYVMLGDPVNMTEGIPGDGDCRWVFTEDNPQREFVTAAHLAAVSRALADHDPVLSARALDAAEGLFRETRQDGDPAVRAARVHAAAELFLTTGEKTYAQSVLDETDLIVSKPERLGWIAARAAERLGNDRFFRALENCLRKWKEQEDELAFRTPYGVPYRPHIWGAGWDIQRLGCEHYFLYKAFPGIFTPDLTCHALSFVLGCHPGESISFASGIGARSVTTAYGFNRADASCIPGGVVSGTALIRPDFPELKEWPYLWQQTEYVLGGGSSRFMFLVLAVRDMMGCGQDMK